MNTVSTKACPSRIATGVRLTRSVTSPTAIDRGDRGLAIVVDLDLAPAAQLHARLLQAQPRGVGLAPGGVDHLVEDLFVAVAGLDPDAAVALFHLHHVGAEMQIDAAPLDQFGDMAARLVVEAAQDLRAAVILRGLRRRAR